MPVCGLKLCYFGLVLSTWGVVQLALTGVFLHFRATAFVEDIRLKDQVYTSAEELRNDLEVGYAQSALNCWVASLLYVITFCVSAQQFWMHQKVEEVPSEQFY